MKRSARLYIVLRPYIIICVIFLCLLHSVLPCKAQKVGKEDYFYVLNTQQGLSDNHVLQMMQLPDDRLVVRTQKGINVYDGKQFRFIPLYDKEAQRLGKYDGQTHLYVDSQDRLWVKDNHRVYCIDLRKTQVLLHPLDSLRKSLENADSKNALLGDVSLNQDTISDLFVDSKRNVWAIVGKMAINTFNGRGIHLKDCWGNLQDLDTDGDYVYTFHSLGTVAAFKNGKLAYTVSAYSPSEALCYQNTSLTVSIPRGQFYQIRTGYNEKKHTDASVFLHFDSAHRKYSKIFACEYVLHTLNMSLGDQALISSQYGYLMFDLKVGNAPREVKELTLPNGKSLITGINTVYRDREGAIWLGTYNDGLIYVSPMLGLFFTINKPWWKSEWAFLLLTLLVILIVVIFLYRRKKWNAPVGVEGEMALSDKKEDDESLTLPVKQTVVEEEPEFVHSIRTLVEQHLENSEYGVEQLARDLCMERTGLYKKLTALSKTTPVVFIRQIRLQHAAILLKEEKLTVNEIAERTGFSSPSYFTKCFKKEFGVLPSEYK